MRLKAKISVNDQKISAKFGKFNNISDGGFERGYAEGESVGYEKGHAAGTAEGIEQGKQSEYDRFWDAYQQDGQRTDYSHAFRGVGWTDENFKPKYPLQVIGAAESMCTRAAFTEIPVTVDFSQCDNIYYCFDHCSNLLRLLRLDLSNVKTANFGLGYCSSLEEIRCLVFSENTVLVANTFQACSNLKELTVEGTINTMLILRYASKLTDGSVQSIIDHLKDLAGGETKSLHFHTDVGAKLTDTQKATITAKNWTLVY